MTHHNDKRPKAQVLMGISTLHSSIFCCKARHNILPNRSRSILTSLSLPLDFTLRLASSVTNVSILVLLIASFSNRLEFSEHSLINWSWISFPILATFKKNSFVLLEAAFPEPILILLRWKWVHGLIKHCYYPFQIRYIPCGPTLL